MLKNYRFKKIIPSAILAIFGLACYSAIGGEPPATSLDQSFSTTIIWSNEELGRAAFLPQSLLQGANVADLPLTRHQKEYLDGELDKRRVRDVGCEQYPPLPDQGEAPDAKGFTELLSTMPATFVGTVVDVQDGWAAGRLSVAELAFISVDEALSEKLDGAGVERGQIVNMLFMGGKVIIDDQVFCKEQPTSVYRPTVGDRILVGGRLIYKDQGYFYYSAIFPVRGDDIVAQPLASLSEEATTASLNDLRIELRDEN